MAPRGTSKSVIKPWDEHGIHSSPRIPAAGDIIDTMTESLPRRRYTKARDEFRAACDAWNAAGEPPSGPVWERLNRTRLEFVAADQDIHDVS